MRRLLPLTFLLALVLAAPASASRTQAVTIEAPRDLLNPATRPAALDEIQSLGVDRLRVILTWKSVAPDPDKSSMPNFEPSDPAGYAWGEYERLLAETTRRGMSVLMTVSGPVPKWATKAKRDNITRPSPNAYAAFMTAVGRQFGSRVDTWAIWNEPNHPQFLRPQYAKGGRAVSPGIYRQLYWAGRRGLEKAGEGDDTILFGETSPRGNRNVVAPLRFLRGALCLSTKYKKRRNCKEVPADGYAHHAYTTRGGPYFRPSERDDVTSGVLSRLTRALDRAGRAGAITKKLPVYVTEFGIQSTPDTSFGVPLTTQVQQRAAAERIFWSNPRVESFAQYLLRDDEPTGPKQYGGFESGLRFADGKPKPSLQSFRLPFAVKRKGSKVSIWGLVRPTSDETTVTVTYANKGASRFRKLRTVDTDANGYFHFTANWRKDRRWNVEWGELSGSPVESYSGR